MTKYFTVFIFITKYNLIREMEFRNNFFMRIFTQILFVILQLITVKVFFSFTSSIGSWSENEILVLVGLFRLIEGAFHILVHSNLLYLPEIVNYGEFDLLLSKPINTLFLTSFKKQELYEFGTFFTGLAILAYSRLISGASWFYLMFLAFLGFVALFAIMLIFSTLSFYIPRLTALSSIWDVISKISRFPLDIFSNSSRLMFSMVAPLILVVTLPSQLILSKLSPCYILLEILGVTTLFLAANSFWTFSLRHYSSASS